MRTLRFYHKKKLLVPSSFNEKGHRLYSKQDLFLYQKIITFKYLDYSLDQIAEFLHNPELNLIETISFQKRMLVEKQKNLQKVIDSLETVESVLSDEGESDPQLILSFIHTFQQGEEKKQWLSSFLSKEVVDVLFSLVTQKKYWMLLSELTNIMKSDASSSAEAQIKVMALSKSIESLFTPVMIEELERHADRIKDVPPFLMDEVSTELETYLNEMQKEMQKNEGSKTDTKSTT